METSKPELMRKSFLTDDEGLASDKLIAFVAKNNILPDDIVNIIEGHIHYRGWYSILWCWKRPTTLQGSNENDQQNEQQQWPKTDGQDI